MEKTETHILTEIAAGNKLAFEQLFFQYQPQLVAFLTGLTHDPELSRDMAQEIFLSIWNERKKLEQIKSISAYLYQMARYKVYDYFDTFTSVDDVKRDKNYPDIYLYTAKKLGLYPNECIIFEDILIAINTAKESNFKAIGVYDKSSYNDLDKIKVKSDKFIYDFKELL